MKNNFKYLLLVLVILVIIGTSLSLAYFVSHTNLEGSGTGSVVSKTVTLPNFKINISYDSSSNMKTYPGTMNYIIAKVEVIKTATEDITDEYEITYTLNGSVGVSETLVAGSVVYKLYKLNAKIDDVVTCEKPSQTLSGTEYQYMQNCQINEALSSPLVLTTGTGEATNSEEFTYQDTVKGENQTFYYYLITEYPNNPNESQDLDKDKEITSTINDITINNTGVHIPASEKTLAQLTALNEDLVSQGNEAHFDGTSCEDTSCTYQENGIYEAPDENGTTSYYFRGTVENNYVKFGTDKSNADIWWRIIRINGDGSIRMIYAGTSTTNNAPAQTGAGTMIGSYEFNNSYNKAEYVGYQYTYTPDTPVRNGHTTDSNAKTELENWFSENLIDEYNDGYIDKNAGFCGDRTAYDYITKERNDSLGTGTQKTYYGGYIRTTSTHEPTFLCEDKEHDLYTSKEAKEGTKSLTYPIGLTTIDEQVYAGNYWDGTNTKYYLYNSQYYWTMSPFYFSGSCARVFSAYGGGGLYRNDVDYTRGLRPVLNLVSGTLKTGSGTANDPFSIS